ncbi:MAG: alpha/beta hydrolase, partial [Dehalococcoidia bacterium]|nr:alpha/beta hydrolase [Dehalococcoidia bacterium]
PRPETGRASWPPTRRANDIVPGGAPDGPLAGYAHESENDARLDYAAWLDLLKERGHRNIVIGGHSGGAVRAVYANSKEQYPAVSGVIAVSPGEYDHQGLYTLHADEFADAYSWCVERVEADDPDAYIKPGIPGWDSIWTARAFIDCFNPDNRYSVTRRAAELDCPALFVFGEQECGDGPRKLPVCGSAMRSLRDADYGHVTVRVIEGADHGYRDSDPQLFATILGWLSAL